jgi:hypothetical protein
MWQYILITGQLFSYAMVFYFLMENTCCCGMLSHCMLIVIHEISIFLEALVICSVNWICNLPHVKHGHKLSQ